MGDEGKEGWILWFHKTGFILRFRTWVEEKWLLVVGGWRSRLGGCSGVGLGGMVFIIETRDRSSVTVSSWVCELSSVYLSRDLVFLPGRLLHAVGMRGILR